MVKYTHNFDLYNRRFKTVTFGTDKEANDFMEANPNHGVIGIKHGLIHVAHKEDEGKSLWDHMKDQWLEKNVEGSAVTEQFGKLEDLAQGPRIFKNDLGDVMHVHPHSEDHFTTKFETNSGKSWEETHNRNQVRTVLDNFMNKGIRESEMQDQTGEIVEKVLYRNYAEASTMLKQNLANRVLDVLNSKKVDETFLGKVDTGNIMDVLSEAKTKKIDIYHKGKYLWSTTKYSKVKDAVARAKDLLSNKAHMDRQAADTSPFTTTVRAHIAKGIDLSTVKGVFDHAHKLHEDQEEDIKFDEPEVIAETTRKARQVHDIGDDELYATSKSTHYPNNTIFVHQQLKDKEELKKVQDSYPYDKISIHTGKQLKAHKGALSHTSNVFDIFN